MLTAENIGKLRTAFRDMHPVHRFTPDRLSFLDTPDPPTSINNLYLQTDVGPLDLLSTIAGVGDYERVRVSSIEVELFGRRVQVISIADLLKAKEALSREKDRLAARELRAIIEKGRPPG